MNKLNIKKFIATIMVLFVILCFNFITFSKTIDLNGINVSLNVETIKKQVGNGVDVKNNNKFSDTEYEKDVKETKDDSVSVELIIKNNNPYEACNVVITEIVDTSFKQAEDKSASKIKKIKLGVNETKTNRYIYKYHKKNFVDKFNDFFIKNKNSVSFDTNDNYIENNNKTNIEDLAFDNKEIYVDSGAGVEIDKSNKNKISFNILFVIIICIVGIIILFICIYVFFIKSKYKDYDTYKFEIFFVTIFASSIISVLLSKMNFAAKYIPQVFQAGQEFTETIKETTEYNGRLYEFVYEIKFSYESRNEIADTDIDTDGDGLTDDVEYMYMTDKNNIDTDSDGLSDYIEVMVIFYNPNNRKTFNTYDDGDIDYDKDGLTNIEEVKHGTDLTIKDTDGDNLIDGDEIHIYNTDPLSIDTDEDGLNDDVEIKLGLDPNNRMTDGVLLDGLKLIDQKYDIKQVPASLREGDVQIVGISGLVNGNIDDTIKISEYKNSSIENAICFISEPFVLKNINNNNLTFTFNVDRVKDRIDKLCIVKYENSTLIPVETNFDDAIITGTLSNGVYGVVDSEYILRDLNIYISDYR